MFVVYEVGSDAEVGGLADRVTKSCGAAGDYRAITVELKDVLP